MTVAIINNGGANMNSLIYALDRLRVDSILTTRARDIESASHVILPGVGHATDSMARLDATGVGPMIDKLEQPLLGICLGMQILYEHSDEGDTDCLGLIPGQVRQMAGTVDRPAPHMGWNQLEIRSAHPLLDGIETGSYFYFVHGFTAEVTDHTIASSHYGYSFTSVAARDNFMGVQFHPERSGPNGARLLQNFLNMT